MKDLKDLLEPGRIPNGPETGHGHAARIKPREVEPVQAEEESEFESFGAYERSKIGARQSLDMVRFVGAVFEKVDADSGEVTVDPTRRVSRSLPYMAVDMIDTEGGPDAWSAIVCEFHAMTVRIELAGRFDKDGASALCLLEGLETRRIRLVRVAPGVGRIVVTPKPPGGWLE